MRIELNYDQLADTMARVLTTGPDRLARLAAIEDPWPEEDKQAERPAAPAVLAPSSVQAAATQATPPAPAQAAPAAPERSEALPAERAAPVALNGVKTLRHPILDQDDMPEGNMGDWVERRQREARMPYQPWDEIIRRIRAGEFRRQADLAAAFGKPIRWATGLRKVVVSQGVMRADAWVNCFKRGSQYDPALTSQRSVTTGTTPLSREQFEKVMLDKQQDGLTFDLVIQLLRLRCWKTVEDFGAHFRKGSAWTSALRTLLIRERTFTAESWALCFRSLTKKGSGRR